MELEEIGYNNWRWGFKFRNGLYSDFDSDSVLKKFKLPNAHPNLTRVETYYDSWGG